MPLVLVKRIKGKFFSTGIGQFFMLLNVLQIIFVFVIKIILSLRFKERLIYIFLTPVSVCFISFITFKIPSEHALDLEDAAT